MQKVSFSHQIHSKYKLQPTNFTCAAYSLIKINKTTSRVFKKTRPTVCSQDGTVKKFSPDLIWVDKEAQTVDAISGHAFKHFFPLFSQENKMISFVLARSQGIYHVISGKQPCFLEIRFTQIALPIKLKPCQLSSQMAHTVYIACNSKA